MSASCLLTIFMADFYADMRDEYYPICYLIGAGNYAPITYSHHSFSFACLYARVRLEDFRVAHFNQGSPEISIFIIKNEMRALIYARIYKKINPVELLL